MRNNADQIRAFKEAVKLIDGQRRLLADARSDKQVMEAMDALIRYLYRLPPSTVEKILGITRRTASDLSPADIEAASVLSLSEVENRLNDERVLRKDLEAVAVGRFDFPKGSLRSIGKLENLKELISSFVSNERAHTSIHNLAVDK